MSADPGQSQSTPDQGSGGQDAVEGTPGEKDANAPDPGKFEPAKGEDGAPMSPDQLREPHWVDEDNVFHAGMPGPDALAKGGTVDSEGTYHVERDASGNTVPPADGEQDDHGSGGGTSSFYGNGDQGGGEGTSGFYGNSGGSSSDDSSGEHATSSFHGSGSGSGDNGDGGGKYFDENDSNQSYGNAMFDSKGDDHKGDDNGGDEHKGYENKGYDDDKDDKGSHDSHHDDSQHASHH